MKSCGQSEIERGEEGEREEEEEEEGEVRIDRWRVEEKKRRRRRRRWRDDGGEKDEMKLKRREWSVIGHVGTS